MIDGFSKAVKSHMYDRTTSPLLGTFAIMWAIWNYKFLLVLFSSMPVHLKFDFIEKTIYPNVWLGISHGILYPAASAVIFLFLYPYPARFIYEFWHRRQQELKQAKLNIEDEMPLTIKESRQIREEIIRHETNYNVILGNKNSEIEKLKGMLASLKGQVNRPILLSNSDDNNHGHSNVIMKSIVEVDESEFNILRLIDENKGSMAEMRLFELSGLDEVQTEFCLLDLEIKGYLKREYDNERKEDYCKLTKHCSTLMHPTLQHTSAQHASVEQMESSKG